jgi:hypothetical protein
MAGPGCSVLLLSPCPAQDLIEELVGITGNTTHEHGYRINNTYPIGGTYKGDGRPYVWDQESRDPVELALREPESRSSGAIRSERAAAEGERSG